MDPHIIRLYASSVSGQIRKLDPLRGRRTRALTLQVLIIRNLGPSLFRNWSSNTCMHIAMPYQKHFHLKVAERRPTASQT